VGPYAVIEEDARIGARTEVRPFALVAAGVVVGEDCRIGSHVVLRAARLGNRVILHDGVMIGSDGFGYTPDERGLAEKIPQVGTVGIGDDVEVGALSAIDRATTGVTRIGRGVKIDNFVMIAHNCEVGDFSLIAGQSGLSGSTRLGRGVLMGGQTGTPGHLTIGDGAIATAQSGIPGTVEPGTVVSGSPAIDNRGWRKSSAVFAKLPELQRRLRELERKVESLLGGS
jgi:UDP-3-O-[3-hydroxymyristoyl] glucosamine N-acyltransferase